MKIHIVQKGDTLWKLAEQYGVNFEELKHANSHLPNPDMIMPGMKVKIPTGAVHVKHPSVHKEMVKAEAVTPLPQMEMPKMLEYPKMEVPKYEEAKVKAMIKEALAELLPSLVRPLLYQIKPEIVNQIKIELMNTQVMYEKKVPYEKVKAPKPTPPPVKEMPIPYKPEKVKPIMEGPCPPYPPSHYMHGYDMAPMGAPGMEEMWPYDPMHSAYTQPYDQWGYTPGIPAHGNPKTWDEMESPNHVLGQAYDPWGQAHGMMQQPYGTGAQPYGSTAHLYGTGAQPYGSTAHLYGTGAQPYGSTAHLYGTGAPPYGTMPQAYGTAQPSGAYPAGVGQPHYPYMRADQGGAQQEDAPLTKESHPTFGEHSSATQALDVREAPADQPASETLVEEASAEGTPKVSPKSPPSKNKTQSRKSKR